MTSPFDIFRVEPAGVRWLESVASLEEARTRVQEIAATVRGEYLVLDQETGTRVFIKLDESSPEAAAGSSSLHGHYEYSIYPIQLRRISSKDFLRDFFRAVLSDCSVAHHI